MPIHARFWGFWGTFPPNNVTHHPNPKRTVLGLNHVIWAIYREYRSRDSRWALEKNGHDRTGKSHKRVTYLWRSPHWSDVHENLFVGDVLDVIICAKFQNEIFWGYDFTRDQIFYFPIDFWVGLTTLQRYCAACDMSTDFGAASSTRFPFRANHNPRLGKERKGRVFI